MPFTMCVHAVSFRIDHMVESASKFAIEQLPPMTNYRMLVIKDAPFRPDEKVSTYTLD